MSIFINFLPILFFVIIYVGSGLYFLIRGVDNAFYQLSPTVAIMPAIAAAWVLYKGTTQERMYAFLDGVRHRDIITMCIIFLLAGAFSAVTSNIGSIDSCVNLALNFIPPQFLLIGLFVTTAFISTAIGTSVGTIATIAPIAAGLIEQSGLPVALTLGTVVGGAMFGDNLSIISDTTVAAVMSQEADLKAKLRINVRIATIASIITVTILLLLYNDSNEIIAGDYSLILISPYIFLLVIVLAGVNVFISLSCALVFAWIIGFIHHGYTPLEFSKSIVAGFSDMHEIMLLSLMVGGLSGFASRGSKELSIYLSDTISKYGNVRLAQLFIAKIVSIFDILLANNTIAIIFSGEIARDIAKRYNIPKHYSAAWLDIFSCVFQGILPYGAQILLASSIAKVSPLQIAANVHYCYILGGVSVAHIMINKNLK
jgi:Na+/H+ antiporter NhaC